MIIRSPQIAEIEEETGVSLTHDQYDELIENVRKSIEETLWDEIEFQLFHVSKLGVQ